MIHLFQQRITAAIMPPAAFVAVSRLPHPPFEYQQLLPDGMTELMTKATLQSMLNCHDSDNEDTESFHDYQQQTVVSSPVILQQCNTEHSEQPL